MRFAPVLASAIIFWSAAAGSAHALSTPKEVKDSVVFVFTREAQENLVPAGTGFFIGVRDEAADSEKLFTYFVTSKHVALNREQKLLYPLYLRMNTHDGKCSFIELPLVSKGKSRFFTHGEPGVDLLVVPVDVDQSRFRVRFLTDDILADARVFSSGGITEGEEVFFVGLFIQHFGAKRNYPIVRFGKVALMPEEKVMFANREVDLCLIEAEACGGNSGSPVFFRVDPKPGNGAAAYRFCLAGVLQGAFWDAQMFDFEGTAKVDLTNAGIAAVVPAYKLLDILFSDELKSQRRSGRVGG